MRRYCAISFQRPLYEPLGCIFGRPVMVLRVSELRDNLTFIPVARKVTCFYSDSEWKSRWFWRYPWATTGRPKPHKSRSFRLPACTPKAPSPIQEPPGAAVVFRPLDPITGRWVISYLLVPDRPAGAGWICWCRTDLLVPDRSVGA